MSAKRIEMNKPGFRLRSKPFDKYAKSGAYHWVMGNRDRLYMEHVAYIKNLFASAAEEYPLDAVLDVGCGDGFIAKNLADLGLDVLGIDTDEHGLRAAREQFGRIRTKGKVRFEQLDFLDVKESPGSILASDVLEHLYEPNRFVEHLCLLRPTVAVISTPLSRTDGKLWDPDHHVAEYSEAEFIDLFRDSLKEYGITYTVRPHYHAYKTQYLILERRDEAVKSLLRSMKLFKRESVEKNRGCPESLVELSDADIDEIGSVVAKMYRLEVIHEEVMPKGDPPGHDHS